MTSYFPCIVVGAGISGCLAAYRLQKSNPRGSVLLLDEGDKVGGRIFSINDFDGNILELGAMRISEHQSETIRLCEELNIKLVSSFPQDPIDSTLYIDNTRSIFKDYKYPFPDVLLSSTLSAYVINHRLTLAKNVKLPTLKCCLEEDFDQSYYDLSFLAVLRHIFSPQHLNYYIKSAGYDYMFHDDVSFHGVLSANRSINHSCKYYSPSDGMYAIPNQLVGSFIENGGTTLLGKKVISVYKKDDMFYIQTCDQKECFVADMLIVAIPPHHCKSISGLINLVDTITLNEYINCNGSYSSRKTYANFKSPWWDQYNHKECINGSTFRTDLPIKQGFYPPPSYFSNKNNPMLIEYRNSPTNNCINTTYSCSEYADMLSKIHGFLVPPPSQLWSLDWSDHPLQLSAHYLKSGRKFSDFINYTQDYNNDIFFVGEGFSTQHGWISGAIESVDKLFTHYQLTHYLRELVADNSID